MVIFLDTYAMIELAKGNPNYQRFKDSAAITTKFNLAELYFYFLKNINEELAEEIYTRFRLYETPVADEIIKEAMKFKLQNLKKRLSFADTIGYIRALKEKALFLSGDYQFKGLANVEFVV